MESTAEEMVGIPIKEFISATKLSVDIFVQLSSGRFVQVARAGDEVSIDRLMNYENKRVEQLFVKKADYSNYVEQNLVIAGITLTRSDLDGRKKSGLVTQVAHSVAKEMDELEFNQSSYASAKVITRVTLNLVECKIQFTEILEALNAASSEIFAHSLGTSVMSVMLGQGLGWTQQSVLEKLALGGLLHDIGMKMLPKELMYKDPAQMTFEERREYETHPQKGLEMLRALNIVPDDILAMVLEHHENGLGQGYPRRLRNIRIHPMGRVVGLADAFCDLTIKSPTSRRLRPLTDAVAYAEKNFAGQYPKDLLTALRDCLPFRKELKSAA